MDDFTQMLSKLFNEKNYVELEKELEAELATYNSYKEEKYKLEILDSIPFRVRNSKEFWDGVKNKKLIVFASKAIQESK